MLFSKFDLQCTFKKKKKEEKDFIHEEELCVASMDQPLFSTLNSVPPPPFLLDLPSL